MYVYLSQNHQQSFGTKNIEIKKADEISRRVHQAFPVYSNTALSRFKNRNKTPSLRNFNNAVCDLVSEARSYYNISTDRAQFFRMLAAIKTAKVGNCYEQSRLTETACLMNGYKDVRKFFLYSMDPKTGEIKDLDHTVVGINVKLPKNYVPSSPDNATSRDLIQPSNNSIIIDTWAGVVGDAKTTLPEYKGNIYLSTKPDSEDKLLLLPLEKASFKPEDITYLKKKYPQLLLSENKENVKSSVTDGWYNSFKFPQSLVDSIKKQNKLKSSGDIERDYENGVTGVFSRIKKFFSRKS